MKIIRNVTPATDAQRTALRFFDAIAGVEEMSSLFADDIVWTIWGDLPFSGTHRGKQAVTEDFHAVAGPLFSSDGDGVITITELVGEGSVVAVEFNHKNKTAIGRDYNNHYVEVFTIRDKQIAEVREYCDTAHLRNACY
jgi:ketosteroid isomerase-like protein